jgi:sugar (pentulose or hexulose) kinase
LMQWCDSNLQGPPTGSIEPLVSPQEHGLVALPFWGGERATGWHCHAAGALVGITHATTSAHIRQALKEAVCYRLATIVELLCSWGLPSICSYLLQS